MGALKNLVKHYNNTPVGFENLCNSERYKHTFFFYSTYLKQTNQLNFFIVFS